MRSHYRHNRELVLSIIGLGWSYVTRKQVKYYRLLVVEGGRCISPNSNVQWSNQIWLLVPSQVQDSYSPILKFPTIALGSIQPVVWIQMLLIRSNFLYRVLVFEPSRWIHSYTELKLGTLVSTHIAAYWTKIRCSYNVNKINS